MDFRLISVFFLVLLISCGSIQKPQNAVNAQMPSTQEKMSVKSTEQVPESAPLTPEEVRDFIEAGGLAENKSTVEDCLPEQNPVSIRFSFKEHFVTGDLTRLDIENMVFEGYDYKAEYYRFMNCRFGSSEGENVNYIYCGDSFMPIEVKFIDNSGTIVDTVGLRFVFDKNKDHKLIETVCYP